MGYASVDVTSSGGSETENSLLALVLWRLHDPAWTASFPDLLEDARTCVDPATEATSVLAALRTAVTSDHVLAPRARILAVQAARLMATRAKTLPSACSTGEAMPRRRPHILRPVLFEN